jgi:hypothetical protein
MNSRSAPVVLLLAALGASGCTPTTELGKPAPVRVVPRSRVATTHTSAVAVTQDERVAVVANRTDGIVSILHLDPAQPLAELVSEQPPVELPFHPLNESKPWVVAIAPDDDTAFVLLRGLQRVVRISGLHGESPKVDDEASADVGSEPTSMAISPSGKFLYVANSGEGTISSIVTDDLSEARWDLNLRLARLGQLGRLLVDDSGAGQPAWTESQLQEKRPALAHPRAIAMTDNGDDSDLDELLFATEFFSQPLPEADPSLAIDKLTPDLDRNRHGIVYPIELSGQPPQLNDKPTEVIMLGPVESGFKDTEGNATGCFPNQLYDIAAVGDRLYVTSMCTSPNGPVDPGLPGSADVNANFKTLLHPTVFTIDRVKLSQAAAPLVLTALLEPLYVEDSAADRRMPLIPSSIVFAPPTDESPRQAYISALGSSAVFPLNIAEDGSAELGSEAARFVDLGLDTLPVGLAVLSEQRALVVDDRKPGLAVVDFATLLKVTSVDTVQVDRTTDPETEARELVSDDVREGRRLFATGLEVWSFAGQAWSSCEACHPEGLSDGVTWRFSRGPRRSISLAGTYFQDDEDRRLLLWTANLDEIHDVEVITRNLSGGAGGVVWNPYAGTPSFDCRLLYDGNAKGPSEKNPDCDRPRLTSRRLNGLTGSLAEITIAKRGGECQPEDGDVCDVNGSRDWDKIDAFVRSVRAPRAPTTLDAALVSAGEDLFKRQRCAGCHGGPGWTTSRVFYRPGLEANGNLPFEPLTDVASVELQLSSLLGTLRTTTYALPSPGFVDLNPALKSGTAFFRSTPPAMATPQVAGDYLFVRGNYPNPPPDQLNCALRAVGTFPVQPPPPEPMMPQPPPNYEGVVPDGAPRIWEGRHIKQKDSEGVDAYTDLVAAGGGGFNIPSLVGLSGGGPYFHAGNARSLEEVFDAKFLNHYNALAPVAAPAPTPDEIQQLVSYLLSIDESDRGRIIDVPAAELGFDPDLCAQFAAN